MKVSGLHLLLTYRCTLECDHCFVWGAPRQTGAMSTEMVRGILRQAKDLGAIDSIYFEGGEPFLCYDVLLQGAKDAARMGFRIGIVSNAFWATDPETALQRLQPFAGMIGDLSISCDSFHQEEIYGQCAKHACGVAVKLGIPYDIIRVARPGTVDAEGDAGAVMFRGRAAERLVSQALLKPWGQFTACPHEDLSDPGRLHVDLFGNLHICQGIVVGNVLRLPLREVCKGFDPKSHPITGPLIAGGPVELVRRYRLLHKELYADACHLCYEARKALRRRFPEFLGPDQVYGVRAQTQASA